VSGPIVLHTTVFTLCEWYAEGEAGRFAPITSFVVLSPYSGQNERSVTGIIETLSRSEAAIVGLRIIHF
jgi:hypothetical protein